VPDRNASRLPSLAVGPALGLVVLFGSTPTLAAEPATSADHPDHRAQARAESDAGDGLAHALTLAARAGNPGYGGLLGYRVRLRHGIGLGFELEGSFAPRAYIGGYPVDQNAIVGGRVPLFFPVHRARRLTVALTLAPGVRATRSFDPGFAESSGLALTVNLGVTAYLRAHERLTLTLGIDNPVSIQIDPIVDLDQLGTLLVFGPVVPINQRLSWYASVEAGGLFGSDGDAGKFFARGTTGVRVVLGASAMRWRAF